MHHNTLFASILALLSVAAASVPRVNLADGSYQVRRAAIGTDIHSSLGPPSLHHRNATSSSLEQHLAKRDSWGSTWCGCGNALNPIDTSIAYGDLKNQLTTDGVHIDPGAAYYSIKGSVVVFVCNLDSNAYLNAWADLLSDATTQIKSACGTYVAGTQGGVFDFAVGYMLYSEGLDFCGASQIASTIKCPT